jgi:hypothetical protein
LAIKDQWHIGIIQQIDVFICVILIKYNLNLSINNKVVTTLASFNNKTLTVNVNERSHIRIIQYVPFAISVIIIVNLEV